MPPLTGAHTGLPIYAGLAARLRESISGGRYQPGELIGSEHELARQESISRMTVRRASELLVNEGLIERRPGKGLYVASARQLTPAPVGTLQIIVGNLLWETTLRMARGVQKLARNDGFQVHLYDAHGDIDLNLELIDQLPKSGVQGAVIVSLNSPRFSDAICRLHATGFPFVLLDQRMHDLQISSVVSDNYDGGYQAGRFLVDNGHKSVAFIGDLIAATVRERLNGFRDAVGDAGLPIGRSQIIDLVAAADRFGDWSSAVADAAKQLITGEHPPTAIFCSSDSVARDLYRSLNTMGLDIPGDISIVGYDDDPLAEWLQPSLTTVRQPFEEMGQAAMGLLQQRIANPAKAAESVVLPVELVRRGSVAPRSA
jgi:DNA-binding LacI/PurR family transcriptional regulator